MSETSNQQTESTTTGCTGQYSSTAHWYDLIYRAHAPDDLGFYLERARLAAGEDNAVRERINLVELCGFKFVETLADFRGTPMHGEIREQIYVCEAQHNN